MKYFSTRDEKNVVSFKEAVLTGIAEDGGLFVPEDFPKIDLKKLSTLSYKELAFEILKLYVTDFSEAELKEAIDEAYDEKFPENPAPLKKAGSKYYLELYHGPTFAFKDFALSILPKFMEIAKRKQNADGKILILTATSGDTGSASLKGFSNVKNIDIVVFYPKNGVSPLQEIQMTSNDAENSLVVGIYGNFDDAQTGVKELFADEDILRYMKKKKVSFSSANSINIGRLLPQIVYYFHAYFELLRHGEINLGDEISFSVPTGNFGDILALYYGKKMGLPVKKLIVASNANNVLTEFFNTGVYDRNRELILTSSPSMDIIISSNLERLIYDKTKDTNAINAMQKSLKEMGEYKLSEKFFEYFAGYCDEENTIKTIRRVYEDDGYLIDPHTAVASFVADSYKKSEGAYEKLVVLSTASPYKFSNTIMKALGIESSGELFEDMKKIEEYTHVCIPEGMKKLEEKNTFSKNEIEISEMKSTIMSFIGERNEN